MRPTSYASAMSLSASLLVCSVVLPNLALADIPELLDPAKREAARVAASQNAVGFPLRDRTNQVLQQLGFGTNDRFELKRAHADDRGWTHAVLQQTRHDIPVYGATLVAHRDPRGEYASYTDKALRNIRTSNRPTVSSSAAVAIVESDRSHAHSFAAAPTSSLFYYPVFERMLASGEPLPPARYNYVAQVPMVEPINAADVVTKHVATHLAWRIVGVEYDAANNKYRSAFWWVSAHSGEVLATGDLSHSATGTGVGAIHGSVSFATTDVGSCFEMDDDYRQFSTETEDFSSDHAVNCDGNDAWGDGAAFVGELNLPTDANYQTAMVDGHFGATVYWDMMDKVFQFKGPDNDFYSVNVFMHDGTVWSNAAYHSLSGNVSFGDGTDGMLYTSLDVLGHELGHAWADHNTDYGSGMLNESLADIFGEWTDTYLGSGNWAFNPNHLGQFNDNPTNWTQSMSRHLVNPSLWGDPSYWTPQLYAMEINSASLPASRAFTFLANGSSPWMNLNNYSRLLPWGMPGVGLEKAADIYMRSHQDYPPGDAYSELRDSMYVAALIEAGGVINHDWVKAVANAYAGINVGDVFQGTPIDVQQVDEIDVPNDTIAQAQGLGLGSPPPAGAVLPAPHKLRVMGGGNDNDFYTARLRGDVINVLVTPTFNSPADHQPYALIIWELTPAPVIRGIAFPSLDPQLVTAVFPSVKDRSILITVVPGSGTTVNSTYQLDIDLDQNVP